MAKDLFKRLSKRARAFPCPSCGFWIPRDPLLRKPFTCPGCRERLQLAKIHGWGLAFELVLAVVLAVILPFLVGARGVYLALIAVIAFFPALFLAASETGTLFGKLEIRPGEPPKSKHQARRADRF